MKTSEQGKKLIILREGYKNFAYKDTKGIWSIGVGHTANVKEGDRANDDQIFKWLGEDLKIAEDCINKNVKVPLTQNQFDALVSFVFNVGTGAFERSTLLKVLNLGNYVEAGNQFDRWHIPIEITSRRNSERDQFRQV